jgi:hypothetical protein
MMKSYDYSVIHCDAEPAALITLGNNHCKAISAGNGENFHFRIIF